MVQCDAPSVPMNSVQISPSASSVYDFNTVISYECVIGFELVFGHIERICTEQKVWSGEEPVCKSKFFIICQYDWYFNLYSSKCAWAEIAYHTAYYQFVGRG